MLLPNTGPLIVLLARSSERLCYLRFLAEREEEFCVTNVDILFGTQWKEREEESLCIIHEELSLLWVENV